MVTGYGFQKQLFKCQGIRRDPWKMNEAFKHIYQKISAVKSYIKWRPLYHATYHFSLGLMPKYIRDCVHSKNEHIVAITIYVLLG